MSQRADDGPDRTAIYAAVISALIEGAYANFDPRLPVTCIDATARSSAGPAAVKDAGTSPIPVEVQHRIAEALAARTEAHFTDDPQSVIQPGSRVRDGGVSHHAGAGTARRPARGNRGTVLPREPRHEELRVHRGRGRRSVASDRHHRCLRHVITAAGSRRCGPAGGPDTIEVRQWARARGIKAKDRGRVPAGLVVKFKAATDQQG
jgi:hypothetical protein